jgi:DNA-directed RNA polymerase specialized sigma24 family protein
LAPAVQPDAIPRLQLRDLEVALSKIPDGQREVILLVGLEGITRSPKYSAYL